MNDLKNSKRVNMDKSYLIINRIDDICNYNIKGSEKIVLIKDIIKDWRNYKEDTSQDLSVPKEKQ